MDVSLYLSFVVGQTSKTCLLGLFADNHVLITLEDKVKTNDEAHDRGFVKHDVLSCCQRLLMCWWYMCK